MEDADDLVNMISLNGKVVGGEQSCKNSIITDISKFLAQDNDFPAF